MRSWAVGLIFACTCLVMFMSAARQEMMGQYRELDNIVVLTGGNIGDNEHMFRFESDLTGEDAFFGRICGEDGFKPGMVIKRLVFRMDYARSCWDKSAPGGIDYRRDHEHKVVYVPVEQAQR